MNEQGDRPGWDEGGKLAAELRGLYRAPVAVEARVDAAAAAVARERAALAGRRAGLNRRVRRWGMVAAAGLAVGVFFVARMAWQPAGSRLAMDVNGDGGVDILDALALARALDGPGPRTGLVDLTGDGKLDRADVDRVAMAAVRLKVGGNG